MIDSMQTYNSVELAESRELFEGHQWIDSVQTYNSVKLVESRELFEGYQ